MTEPRNDWHFWIDRGGTFTDVVAQRPDGAVVTAKYLSEDPARPGDAAVNAIRDLTACPTGAIPPCAIRMGSTVATNALLERKGAPTLLAITQGFKDALTIGTQDRPDLFARAHHRPAPPHAAVIEIAERVTADGDVVTPLDREAARAAMSAAHKSGLDSIAIVLMHGYRYPAHEQELAAIAREVGFTQISTSHDVSALIKLIGRGDTTLADAYLSPILRRYVDQVCTALGDDIAPQFMKSSGGLAAADNFHGRDAILSGPAGGIVGMVGIAEALGLSQLIGFDMGGTSTDVSHYAGRLERDNETMVAGTRIRAPMLRIHTVAAGGGSICRWDGARLLVGPESAGANPGPAAYGRGGPLTVTDCNVLLGKISPAHFPRLFGAQGNEALDTHAVAARFGALTAEVNAATGQSLRPEALAEGLLAIAVQQMANAIKRISIARGHDVTQNYALVGFGGAGGQHVCLVADALGIGRIILHPLAGVLSAFGMGLARPSAIRERTINIALDDNSTTILDQVEAELTVQAEAELTESGERRSSSLLFVRLADSDNVIELPRASPDGTAQAFAAAFRQQFGYAPHDDLVIDRIRVEVSIAATDAPALPRPTAKSAFAPEATRVWWEGAWHNSPLHQRDRLPAGAHIPGPAIIVDALSTTLVDPGWDAEVLADGTLSLIRTGAAAALVSTPSDTGTPDPVRLEIFNSLFMAIAEEMGGALQHSASSINIRERLDFSCALFDAQGRLVANAPHMPVHLGSMGESVRTILRQRGTDERGQPRDGRGIRAGDAYALNAPYDGGTHLPDITVVMPVFVTEQPELPGLLRRRTRPSCRYRRHRARVDAA